MTRKECYSREDKKTKVKLGKELLSAH